MGSRVLLAFSSRSPRVLLTCAASTDASRRISTPRADRCMNDQLFLCPRLLCRPYFRLLELFDSPFCVSPHAPLRLRDCAPLSTPSSVSVCAYQRQPPSLCVSRGSSPLPLPRLAVDDSTLPSMCLLPPRLPAAPSYHHAHAHAHAHARTRTRTRTRTAPRAHATRTATPSCRHTAHARTHSEHLVSTLVHVVQSLEPWSARSIISPLWSQGVWV
jgi:hypothetical protein